MNVTRRRYTDVRDSLTCVFYRRTSSTGVRICLAYVIWWRTHIVTTCSCDVRIFLAYIFYPRTYSIDVRVQSTYVFCERTWFRDGRFRDYAFGDRDSGLRSRNRGFGTTDLMQKTAVDSFLGLSIASKIIMTFVIYDCDVDNKITVYLSLYNDTHDLVSIVQHDTNGILAWVGIPTHSSVYWGMLDTISNSVVTFREHFEHSRTFANFCDCYAMAIE